MKRFAILFLALSMAACGAHVLHPGAANKFDSDAYDVVLVTHAIIETTKADLANNAFPPEIAAKVKVSLNILVRSYDTADSIYIAYHNAALAGTSTVAQSTAVTNALNDVKAQTTTLTLAKAGKS